jgi:hypothetical protein
MSNYTTEPIINVNGVKYYHANLYWAAKNGTEVSGIKVPYNDMKQWCRNNYGKNWWENNKDEKLKIARETLKKKYMEQERIVTTDINSFFKN